jgi:hypothetical protein
MISPRATLMSTLPAFIGVKRSLSKRRVVSGVHWQQITTKSLSGKNRSRSPGPPSSLNPKGKSGCGWRRVPRTRIPSAAQSLPTSLPIPPAPTTHAILPSNRSGYFRFGKEAIAWLVGPRARGAWRQVPRRGEGRPSFANFAVIPAPRVDQFDRRIDGLNLRSIFGTDALNTQDVGTLHVYSPEPFAGKREIIVLCTRARSRRRSTNLSMIFRSRLAALSDVQGALA